MFISNLLIPQVNASDQAKADQARDKYFRALEEVEREMMKTGQRWVQFDNAQQSLPAANRLTYDQWYAAFAAAKIGLLQQNARSAAQDYSSWIVKAGGGYASIATLISDFNNPAFQILATDPNGLVLSYRAYNIQPDLGEFITDSQSLPAGSPPGIRWEFDRNSGRIDSTSTTMGGGFSLWGGWWSFGGGGGYHRDTLDVTTNDFHMRFTAKAYQVFTIGPSQWFDGNAVKGFQNGPWVPGGPVANGTTKLWGSEGIFNLMPAQLIAVYKPRIYVQMTSTEYSRVRTSISGSTGFSIGPFGFGADYHRETVSIAYDDANHAITVEDVSEVPQILAIVSNVLPNFE